MPANLPVIITLEGPQGKGKTTTIDRVYNLLIKTRDCFIVKDRQKVHTHDFFAILEKRGKKIGISSYGDSVSLIKKKLDLLAHQNCSIILTACHPGRIKNFVENYPGFSKEFVKKTIAPRIEGQVNANNSDARIIIELIERYVY